MFTGIPKFTSFLKKLVYKFRDTCEQMYFQCRLISFLSLFHTTEFHINLIFRVKLTFRKCPWSIIYIQYLLHIKMPACSNLHILTVPHAAPEEWQL